MKREDIVFGDQPDPVKNEEIGTWDLVITTELNGQVREFFAVAGQKIGEIPGIPDADTARLRARLILEEAFEFAEAIFPKELTFALLKEQTLSWISRLPVKLEEINFPELIDATIDLDYVSEGARIAFGVNGTPIAAEVHRTNMAKQNGPVDEHGKKQKPVGWLPPDIEGELIAQGWTPPKK